MKTTACDKVVFLRFEPAYQKALVALHRSAIEGFAIGIAPEQEESDLRDIPGYYFANEGEFLVGLLEGSLVAMGGFRRVSPELIELKRMRIARDLQGRGIGTLLLRELESRAWHAGIREVCLETAKRRPATLAFYRKHGYAQTGESRYGSVETLKFSKTLTRPGETAS